MKPLRNNISLLLSTLFGVTLKKIMRQDDKLGALT